MEQHKKYLRPEVVARLASIELKARLVVEGFITGLHRSPYHGFSVEFAEHRAYRPGDELKYIDWKIFGRTNRHYVKQFEEETNLRAMIAMDKSASMNFSSSKELLTKFEYATYIAAALAYMMMHQKDAVGLALYDIEVQSYFPPSSKISYLGELLRALDTMQPANQTGMAGALDRLAERISRRGLVVIISDFFDDIESIRTALKHFRHRNHEVIAMQVLDPRELDFKFGWDATFRDVETGEEMVTQPHQIRKSYIEAITEHNNRLKQICHQQNVDYVQVDTSQSFDRALTGYLARRAKL